MLKAYYELTKPERTLANVITGLAGYLFASHWHIAWTTLLALLVGLTLIIASACVFNNCIDRDMDGKMARTKKRVLVSGTVRLRSALIYASLLGVIGFIVLTYTNWLTVVVGVVGFLSYVLLYDYAKRTTVHGTLVGTIPGAASIVGGYTAATNHLDATAWLLFLLMLAWQMAHFYAIAIYRLKDYTAAGVPVWPARYGVKNTQYWIVFYVVVFVLANVLLLLNGAVGYAYAIVMTLLGLEWLRRGLRGFKKLNPDKWARGMFGFSLVVLLTFAAILTVGPLLP